MATENGKQQTAHITDASIGQRTITIQMRPTDDAAHVRLNDFIVQLMALKDAINQTARLMFGDDGGLDLRIIALGQNSPPFVTVEVTGKQDTAVVGRFFRTVDALASADESVRSDLDLPALEAFRKLAPTHNRQISELFVSDERERYLLDPVFARRVAQVAGPDERSEGSVDGALEVVNLHNQTQFAIFTTLGRKVTCNFPPPLKQTVIAALEKYVHVSGTLRYKQWDPRPHEIDAKSLTVFDEDPTAPDILSLAGLNPDIVGDVDADDYLTAVRSAAK